MKIIVLLSIFIATNAFAGWGKSSSRSSFFKSSPSRSIFRSTPSKSSSFSTPSSPSKSSFTKSSSSSSASKSNTTKKLSPNTVKSSPPTNGAYKKVGSNTNTTSTSSVHNSKPYKSPSKTYTSPSTSLSKPNKASFGKTYLWSAATGSATIGYLMGGSITGALLYSSLHSKSNRHTSNAAPTQEFKVGDQVTDGKETLTVEKITRGEDIPLAIGTQIKNDKGENLTITEVDTQNGETTYTLSNGTKVKGTKHDKLVYTFTNGSKAMDMSHFKLVK